MDREPVVHRRYQDGLAVKAPWHLPVRQVLILKSVLFLHVHDRGAPVLLFLRWVRVNCKKYVLALLTDPASLVECFDNAFAALVAAEVRLHSLLTRFYLLRRQFFDLRPVVHVDVVEVNGVLAHLQLRLFLAFFVDGPQRPAIARFYDGLDNLVLVCILYQSRLCFEIDRKDELGMVQNTLVNERRLHQGGNLALGSRLLRYFTDLFRRPLLLLLFMDSSELADKVLL